jgi:hypothetical protein
LKVHKLSLIPIIANQLFYNPHCKNKAAAQFDSKKNADSVGLVEYKRNNKLTNQDEATQKRYSVFA